MLGFLKAAQDGNYKSASDYLQISAARRPSQGQNLAEKLKKLMDSSFVGSLRRLSTSPDGSAEYGTSVQQTIGTFTNADADVPVVLVRVADPSAGKIWLFSADTLSKVPDLYDTMEAHQVENKLPPGLVRVVFLGMPLWQWLALLAAIPVSFVISWALVLLLAIPNRLWLKYRRRQTCTPTTDYPYHYWLRSVRSLTVQLPPTLACHCCRVFTTTGSTALCSASGFFWFLLRATSLLMYRLRIHAISLGKTGTGTLMVLGERLLKAFVVILAILALLSLLGFNLTTVLAGLGIGGIAIAFAAQKTLENLFGGISVLADEVIRVGDTCRFGDRVGTVEDISLRSTRVRTDARTELSIPNGMLATMTIENLTRRDKILFNPTILVRCETTADQLRYLLAEIRRMLYEHPKVENDTARIRLAGFDNSALNLEVFSYVLTRDAIEFAAIREDLLLRIMNIVENSGTDFAFPSRTVYFSRDAGLDKEKTEAAEKQVEQWRDQRRLPFP